MDANKLNELRDLSAQIGSIDGLKRERNQRIASMLRYGDANVAELMGATGLTKSRLYQIFEAEYGLSASEVRSERP